MEMWDIHLEQRLEERPGIVPQLRRPALRIASITKYFKGTLVMGTMFYLARVCLLEHVLNIILPGRRTQDVFDSWLGFPHLYQGRRSSDET